MGDHVLSVAGRDLEWNRFWKLRSGEGRAISDVVVERGVALPGELAVMLGPARDVRLVVGGVHQVKKDTVVNPFVDRQFENLGEVLDADERLAGAPVEVKTPIVLQRQHLPIARTDQIAEIMWVLDGVDICYAA